MNVKKFIAVNAREALRKVKETLGPDAIILSNRGVPGGVEIMAVASRDMAMIVPGPSRDEVAVEDYKVSLSSASRPAPAAAPARPAPAPRAAEMQPSQRGAAANPASGPIPAVARPAQRPAPRPEMAARSGTTRAVREEEEIPAAVMMEEIRALRKIVEQHMAGFAWGETARMEPVKTDMLRQMLDAGFSPQFSRELLAELPAELDASQAQAWIKGAADRSLLTIGNDNDIIDRGGVYALVGPTGVGKTTTTAKLAARCVVRHGADKLALVTTDGYRIGAHEQLRIYGRILGVSVHLVRDVGDLRNTLEELSHKHMVLIDTMGMSQKDRLVAEQISAHLAETGVPVAALRRMWLHQANLKMNELVARKVLGSDATVVEAPVILDRYANTSSAGSIIAFHLHRDGLVPGDAGVICSFGAGYSIGSIVIRRTA